MKTAVTKLGAIYRVVPPARPEPKLQCLKKKGRYLNPDWIQWRLEQGGVKDEQEAYILGATLLLDRSLMGRLRGMTELLPRNPADCYHVAIKFSNSYGEIPRGK